MSRRQRLRAAIERFLYPGYGCCRRCHRPWACVAGHTTMVTPSRGIFPLCKRCWAELKSPRARLPFYRSLWESWQEDLRPCTWFEVVVAVEQEGIAAWLLQLADEFSRRA